jgi:glyoxylate carboligase
MEESLETITAGRAVVDVLKAEGVRLVFGVPGGHVLGIYDALYDTRGEPTKPLFSLARAFAGHAMIELIEYTETQEQVYDRIYRASVGWDGRDLIRQTDR